MQSPGTGGQRGRRRRRGVDGDSEEVRRVREGGLLREYGDKEIRSYGDVGIRRYGDTEIRRCRDMEIRRYGVTELRSYGDSGSARGRSESGARRGGSSMAVEFNVGIMELGSAVLINTTIHAK